MKIFRNIINIVLLYLITIVVSDPIPVFSQPCYNNPDGFSYDFGFQKILTQPFIRKWFKDFSRIDTIYLAGIQGKPFLLSSPEGTNSYGNFPWVLKDTETVWLTIFFQPTTINSFVDTIHIIGDSKKGKDECRDYIIVIRGKSILDVELWVLDVKDTFFTDTTRLGIRARNLDAIRLQGLNNMKLNYSFTVSVNADLFKPARSDRALLVRNEIVGTKNVMELEGDSLELDGSYKLVARIAGSLLYPKEYLSPVEVSNVVFTDVATADTINWINVLIRDGSLEAIGACQQMNRIVIMDKAPVVRVTPLPVSSVAVVNMETTEKKPFTMELFNLFGRQIYSSINTVESVTAENTRTEYIDMSQYSSGVYLLRITTMYHQKTVLIELCK